MVFKILRFSIKLIKSEIFFKKPELSDIIFLGRPTYNESFFCKQNFDLLLANKKNTIAVWHEYYNLFVIFICLIKFKFTFLDYCQEYINLTKPKLIISFLDNYDLIYKLQGKNCKKIVIQNGYRFGSNIINFKLRKIKKKSVDFAFVYNKHIGKKFKKYVKKSVLPVGSLLLNSLKFKKFKKFKYKYLYISSYRKITKDNLNISPKTSYKKFQEREKYLIQLLHKYISKKNETLYILGTIKSSKEVEQNYYNKIINSKKNWKLIKPEKRHYSFAYKCVTMSEIILGIDSTLLYESFALGKKIIFFDCRVIDSYLRKNRHFAWPYNFERKGFFWTDQLTINSISLMIDKIKKTNQKKWRIKTKKYIPYLMNYDEGNLNFKKVVSKILKN